MLFHLQNYHVTIKCCLGNKMLVTDALSCYAHHLMLYPEIPLKISIILVHITPQKKIEFQATICDYPLLDSLTDTILTDWPEGINDVRHPLNLYHDILTVENGFILHGEAPVISPVERGKIFQATHEGNLSITQLPVMCLKICLLEWNQFGHQMYSPNMCYMPTSSPTVTTTATLANPSLRVPMTTHWCWLIPPQWIWVPTTSRFWLFAASLHPNAMLQRQLFAEHGIPESPCTDNGPKFANAVFAEFATEW